ncbi:N-acetyltransferase family protein [Streptomyces sp. Tue6028]|uniref:GNAT family N-acetyltransferase n=1 Tax=Streptomyces sp. Tue6028 TaxID=2036037 RepID=UPI003D759042
MLKDITRPDGLVRLARLADLPAVAKLCSAHASFERAEPVPSDLATRLEPVLFSDSPRAWCLVADYEGVLIGYSVCSLEFSTWQAAEYMHLDCLYVSEAHRGAGWGAALLDAVKDMAAILQASQIQWQTPDWNTNAIRFYNREGAQGRNKVRFFLPV